MSIQIDTIKSEMKENYKKGKTILYWTGGVLFILFVLGIVLAFKKYFIAGSICFGFPLVVFILCLTGTEKYNGLRIFQPEDRAMVEFLGKPFCIKRAGLTIIFPVFMSVRKIIPTWRQGVKLFSERPSPNEVHIDLKNGGKVQLVDPTLWIRLRAQNLSQEEESVLRAVYGVDDYLEATQEVTEDALRTCLNNLTVEEVLSITHDKQKRSWWDVVAENFSSLEGAIASYGFDVKGLTISDFNWDEEVVKTRQAIFKEERSVALAEYSLKASKREIIQKSLEWGGVFGNMVKILQQKQYGALTKKEAVEEAGRIVRHYKSAESGTQIDAYINGGAGSESSLAATLLALYRGATFSNQKNNLPTP